MTLDVFKTRKEYMNFLAALRYDAERKAFDQGEAFREEYYEYELGAEVVSTIDPGRSVINSKEKLTLFGISVRINFHNPNVMRLWKDTQN